MGVLWTRRRTQRVQVTSLVQTFNVNCFWKNPTCGTFSTRAWYGKLRNPIWGYFHDGEKVANQLRMKSYNYSNGIGHLATVSNRSEAGKWNSKQKTPVIFPEFFFTRAWYEKLSVIRWCHWIFFGTTISGTKRRWNSSEWLICPSEAHFPPA